MSSDDESLQIYISSKYSNYEINGGHYFSLPMIETPSQCHIYISVANASIPISYYSVNTNNNTFNYSITGSSTIYTVTIPVGNHSVLTLQTYLNSVMTNIVVTYNSLTNKYTFTHATSNFTILSLNSTALLLLGFGVLNYTSVSRILTSVNCIDLTPVKTLCVASNLQTGNMNRLHPQSNNILCSFPVDVPKFGLLTYTNVTNFKTNLFTNVLNEIMIKITDQDSNAIDLNGCDWTMTLQIDIIDYVEEN